LPQQKDDQGQGTTKTRERSSQLTSTIDRTITAEEWTRLSGDQRQELTDWAANQGIEQDQFSLGASLYIRFFNDDEGNRYVVVRNRAEKENGQPILDSKEKPIFHESFLPVEGDFPALVMERQPWQERSMVRYLNEITVPADQRVLILTPGVDAGGNEYRWGQGEPVQYLSSDETVATISSSYEDGTLATVNLHLPGHAMVTASGIDHLGRKQVLVGHIRVGEVDDNCIIGSLDFQDAEEQATSAGRKMQEAAQARNSKTT
jgi:hypothetical protein